MHKMARLMAAALALLPFGCAQTSGAAAEKNVPKTTYIVAGRLFDATSDAVRQNVVIVVAPTSSWISTTTTTF